MRKTRSPARSLALLLLLTGCASPPDQPASDAPPRHTRILFVDALPRWEYRYLKTALTREPAFDVHCFLTSADPDFPQEYSGLFAAPLASLPEKIETLLGYDVVILGDVAPENWPSAPGLLNRFVKEHGRGLVLIAGEAHMPRSWAGTELDPLLPVVIATDPPEHQGEFGYRLTEDGKRSRITALAEDPARSAELWDAGLAPLQWILATRARTGAHALVETGPETQPVPLVVTMESGTGRVFFSSTDESWRWRSRVGDQPWSSFWKRAIAWAAG